jgi:hypothetical protein
MKRNKPLTPLFTLIFGYGYLMYPDALLTQHSLNGPYSQCLANTSFSADDFPIFDLVSIDGKMR